MTLTDTRLSFKALGIQAFYPLEFVLDFPTFKKIIPEESFEKSESVGTMVIHLKKAKKGIWRYLIPKESPEFQSYKIKVWWELADVYKKGMKAYNKMIDDEDDLNAGVDWGRKGDTKKNKKDRAKKKELKKKKEKKWFSWLNLFN